MLLSISANLACSSCVWARFSSAARERASRVLPPRWLPRPSGRDPPSSRGPPPPHGALRLPRPLSHLRPLSVRTLSPSRRPGPKRRRSSSASGASRCSPFRSCRHTRSAYVQWTCPLWVSLSSPVGRIGRKPPVGTAGPPDPVLTIADEPPRKRRQSRPRKVSSATPDLSRWPLPTSIMRQYWR